MATVVELPRLSDTMEEGVIARWRIKVGDKVKRGQVIAEIETDKATMEFESFDSGTVLKLIAAEGEAHVHREGLLWQAVRASVAIPGLLPPVFRAGQVFVDGGVVAGGLVLVFVLHFLVLSDLLGDGSGIGVDGPNPVAVSR